MVRVFFSDKKRRQAGGSDFFTESELNETMFRFTPMFVGVTRQTYHEHRPILRCRSHAHFPQMRFDDLSNYEEAKT